MPWNVSCTRDETKPPHAKYGFARWAHLSETQTVNIYGKCPNWDYVISLTSKEHPCKVSKLMFSFLYSFIDLLGKLQWQYAQGPFCFLCAQCGYGFVAQMHTSSMPWPVQSVVCMLVGGGEGGGWLSDVKDIGKLKPVRPTDYLVSKALVW